MSSSKEMLLHSICNITNEDIAEALFMSIVKGCHGKNQTEKNQCR